MSEPFVVAGWTVHPGLHRLEAGSEVRRISPKAMAVLLRLRRQEGGVVSKDELVAAAWDGAFTSDEALTTVLYELRRAFDDDARRPRVLETIRKRGIRLLAPIEPAEPATDDASSRPAPVPVRIPPGAWRGWWLAAGVGAVALLVGTGLGLVRWRSPGPAEAPIENLAVLPFGTFARGDADRLAAALTAVLASDLAQRCTAEVVPDLVLRDRAEPWNLGATRDELGVDAVVEGSVMRYATRLWVSVQLVDARSGRQLWSRSWDREVGDDEAAVLREIALEAATDLGRRLSG